MIDSHCHLDSLRFGEAAERRAVLDAAAVAGLEAIVVPGVAPGGWDLLREVVAAGHPRIRLYACYGIHPQVVPELDDAAVADGLARLEGGLGGEGVAIGECGLDGSTSQQPGGALERQLEILEAHFRIAARFSRPIVLHCLRAHEPLIRFLRARGGFAPGIVLHNYSGSAEQVAGYLELNGYFSFAGPVSYHNARRPVAAARAVPLDRLLVETDAPDQAPEPHRGGRNEPAFLPAVVRAVAVARGMDPAEVARAAAQNTRTLLNLT